MATDLTIPSLRDIADDPTAAVFRLHLHVHSDTRSAEYLYSTPQLEPDKGREIAAAVTDGLREDDSIELAEGDYTLQISIENGMVFIGAPRSKGYAATKRRLVDLLRQPMDSLRAGLSNELGNSWSDEDRVVEWAEKGLQAIVARRLSKGNSVDKRDIRFVAVGTPGASGMLGGLALMFEAGDPEEMQAKMERVEAMRAEQKRIFEEDMNLPVASVNADSPFYGSILRAYQDFLDDVWARRGDELFDRVIRTFFANLSAGAQSYGIEDLHAHLAPEPEAPAEEPAPEADAAPSNGHGDNATPTPPAPEAPRASA